MYFSFTVTVTHMVNLCSPIAIRNPSNLFGISSDIDLCGQVQLVVIRHGGRLPLLHAGVTSPPV